MRNFPLIVGKARKSDMLVAEINALHQSMPEMLRPPFSVIRSSMFNGQYYTAHDELLLVGFLRVDRTSFGVVNILEIGVQANYRRRGIGREMLLAAIGNRPSHALVSKYNAAAQDFFLSNGYRAVGRILYPRPEKIEYFRN